MPCWIKPDFLLKNVLVLQNAKVRRTLWFLWFRLIGPVKRICMHSYTHMWLICIHSWDNWIVCLVFGSNVLVVSKLWNMRRTWLNLIFKPDYLGKSFVDSLIWLCGDMWMIDKGWIWWLSKCVVSFSFTWIVRILWSCWIIMVMLLVIVYVYVHICCWWIFLHDIGVELLV